MLIKSVHLKNIRSYVDEKIEFPEGSMLLSGDIGSGKSTILLSIDFALFGLRRGEISGDDLLRHGTNTGSVKLHMEISGKDVKIERILRRNKDSIAHESCHIIIDDSRYDYTPIELKAKVLELLGYSQELLRKNRPLFRFTVYTPQEQMKQILLYEDERLEILRNIFGIDRYGRIRNNSRIFMTELRLMKREYETMTKDIEDDRKLAEQLRTAKISVSGLLNSEKNKLAEINGQIEEKVSEIGKIKNEFNELNMSKHELTKKETETRSKISRLERIDKDMENVETKIRKNEEEIEKIRETRPVSELKQELTIVEKQRDSLLSERAVMKSEVKNLQMVYDNGICSMCGQAVHDPQTFKSHLDEKSARIREIDSGLGNTEAKIQNIKESIINAEKIIHIKNSHNDLLIWKNEFEIEKDLLKKSIQLLDAEIIRLKTKTMDYDELYMKINKLEEEMHAVQREKLSVEKIVSKYEQQIEDMESRILDLTETIREKEKIKEKISRISDIINWFEPFMALTESIEKHVMVAIQREFNEYFQKWFGILMGEAMTVRIDESFTPVIEQNSYETEYENLSGGEKTSVALAYRLALNKVINDMIENIRTKNILILDEPTDGFSTDQLDRIRDIINELNMRQIIIVSHEPKIDTYVDNVIKIYKEGHVSRVAY